MTTVSRLLVSRPVARAHDLFSRLRDAVVKAREYRRRLEAELFRGRYHLSSKNDDDLRSSADRQTITRRRSVMGQFEPPSTGSSTPSRLFRIGRDNDGHWVVQDHEGLCGGLFVNRVEAVKFAMFENGHCPQAVIMVPGVLELDMGTKPQRVQRATESAMAALPRAA
jgi:hypothetical protein